MVTNRHVATSGWLAVAGLERSLFRFSQHDLRALPVRYGLLDPRAFSSAGRGLSPHRRRVGTRHWRRYPTSGSWLRRNRFVQHPAFRKSDIERETHCGGLPFAEPSASANQDGLGRKASPACTQNAVMVTFRIVPDIREGSECVLSPWGRHAI